MHGTAGSAFTAETLEKNCTGAKAPASSADVAALNKLRFFFNVEVLQRTELVFHIVLIRSSVCTA